MMFMSKLKESSILNTAEALGIIPGKSGTALDINRVLVLWGRSQSSE
jgi:hypothetical protein